MASRVTTLITSIYPPDEGGPSTFTESFGKFLVERGTNVRIMTYADKSMINRVGDNLLITRITRKLPLIIRLPFFSFLLLLLTPSKSKVLANGSFLECLPLIFFKKIELISKIPGDIVWERAVAKKLTNLNVFEFQELKLPPSYRFFQRLFLYTLKKSKRVIVPSKYLYDFCINWGIESERITLLKNTVDTKLFNLSGSEKSFDLIFVGRLVPVKQIEEIMEVATKNNFSLLIVGSGPLESNLKKFAASTGGYISFLGSLRQLDLPKALSSAKVFVQNSQIEATSYALLEARSCGLIAVANEITGASEVIHHGSDGFLFGDEHELSLEEAILLAMNLSGEEIKKFATLARRDCLERFNREEVYASIKELL